MAIGRQAEPAGRSQLIQHLLIHPDEADGRLTCGHLSLAAPNTAWKTAASLDDRALHDATASYRLRGYGLRRVNAFQTRQGVRYAAIWQLGRPTPDHVQTGMDLAAFRATAERLAQQGFAISQIDAARTEAGARFSAIWEAASEPRQKILADLTDRDFANQVRVRAAEALVPRLVAGYGSDGGARFATVFDTARAASLQTDLSLPASAYPSRRRAMKAAGFLLRDASGYAVDGQSFVTAVWEMS
jgi:hypothetical protein